MMAREFGRADVDRFLDQISESQFQEWWAFHRFIEPFSLQRSDNLFGLMAAVLSVFMGNEKPFPSEIFSQSRYKLPEDVPAQSDDQEEPWEMTLLKMEAAAKRYHKGM